MKKTNWLFLAIVTLFMFSCEKLQHQEKIERIHIEGFLLTDNFGNVMGEIGNASDDWNLINWDQLTPLEKSFLEFTDGINMANTRVTTVAEPVAFSNPFQQQSNIHFRSDDSIKLKIAIVDASGYVWRNMAVKTKGTRLTYFDFSNSKEVPSGTSLRYYYSFSAAGQPHFKVGYGDIKVCRNSGEYLSCF
jgi:hypothetical protein